MLYIYPFSMKSSFFKIFILFLRLLQNLFQFFLKLFPWDHDTMVTAQALNANIHSHADDFPAIVTTRVWFFHLNNIIQGKIFICHIRLPLHFHLLEHFVTKIESHRETT